MRGMMTEWYSLLTLLFVTFVLAGGSDQRKLLLENLFTNYRRELRPVLNESSGPTNVTVQLYFKQILKVQGGGEAGVKGFKLKENDQILTLYCWVEEYWLDQFLTWDPQDYEGINEIHVPHDMVWKPDLLVYNNANMNVRDNEMLTNVLVRNDGRVSLFRAIITDITCNLNLHRFPFDQQVCVIMLASWSYDGSQIMIQAAEDVSNRTNKVTAGGVYSGRKEAALIHYIPNMEWTLVDFKYRSNLKYYECCVHPYPDISYYFSIKRNPSYYLFTLIVPSAFITIVTVVGFFTPHSSTGENTEKVSLGVTSLLSLALILMMVSDKLPATSNTVPVLGQYYIGLIVIQFVATYLTTLTLSVQMQGNSGRAIPKRLRQWILNFNRRGFLTRRLVGRELLNTQKSIRRRLRNSDQLRQAVIASGGSAFTSRLMSISGRMDEQAQSANNNDSSGTHPQTSCAMSFKMNGRVGGHPNIPMPVFPAMHTTELTAEAASIRGGEGNRKAATSATSSIGDITAAVLGIQKELLSDEHLKMIRSEWQMLARMIEKVMKLAFVTFTLCFAIYMLHDDQSPPLITEEVINGIKI